MHVLQLLDALFLRPNVEIVEAGLPERDARCLFKEAGLARAWILMFGKQSAGATLFQYLHHCGRIANFWFADQKVDVLRHDDIAYDDETVALAGLFQDRKEMIATNDGAEPGHSPITRTRDKVQVIRAVAAGKAG